MAQPAKGWLNDPAKAIERKVRLPSTPTLIATAGEARAKAKTAQILSEGVTVIGLIGYQGLGTGVRLPASVGNPDGLKGSFRQPSPAYWALVTRPPIGIPWPSVTSITFLTSPRFVTPTASPPF